MNTRTIERLVAYFGALLCLWLLIPPIVKVGPATRAGAEILKGHQFTDPEKEIIQAGIQKGDDYYWDFIVPAYMWKTIPAAAFVFIASSLLLRRTNKTIKNEK